MVAATARARGRQQPTRKACSAARYAGAYPHNGARLTRREPVYRIPAQPLSPHLMESAGCVWDRAKGCWLGGPLAVARVNAWRSLAGLPLVIPPPVGWLPGDAAREAWNDEPDTHGRVR